MNKVRRNLLVPVLVMFLESCKDRMVLSVDVSILEILSDILFLLLLILRIELRLRA